MNLIFSILLLIALMHAGAALECYRCEGSNMCNTKVPCNAGSCAKKYDDDEDKDVRRFCSTTREREGAVKHLSGDNEDVKAYYCNTDLCNDAGHMTVNRLAASLLSLAVFGFAVAFRN